MKTRLPMVALPVLVGLLAVGCPADPAAPPTSTPTPAATATPAPPLGPEQVLEGVKAAMAALGSFHLEGELVIKATSEADEVLLSVQLEGAGENRGDSRLLMTFEIDIPGLPSPLIVEERRVEGVSYTRDPFTGEWAIDDTADAEGEPLEELVPEGMVATEIDTEVLDGLAVYRLTGTVPDDPEQGHVVLWVGADDLLIRQIQVEGRAPATDYEGLIPPQSGDLFLSLLSHLSGFNEPVGVDAPPLGATPVPPTRTPTPTPVFLTSVDQFGFVLKLDRGADVNTAGWTAPEPDARQGILSFAAGGVNTILIWGPQQERTPLTFLADTYNILRGTQPDLTFDPISDGPITVSSEDGIFGAFRTLDADGIVVGGGFIGTWVCSKFETAFRLTLTGEDATIVQLRFDRLLDNFTCAS